MEVKVNVKEKQDKIKAVVKRKWTCKGINVAMKVEMNAKAKAEVKGGIGKQNKSRS